jgi:hypothetical protein
MSVELGEIKAKIAKTEERLEKAERDGDREMITVYGNILTSQTKNKVEMERSLTAAGDLISAF